MAKTFYTNGTILTMNENSLYAEAVCVKDGQILSVGTEKEVMADKEAGDEVVDLHGRTMMPGFIDAHSHFAGAANAMLQCDLSFCESFSDIIREMKKFAEERNLTEEEWIIGRNYDQNFLKEKRHPDKSVLDEISRVNPVLIVHASSHMGVANSKALEMQGINEKTEDCPGGKYGRLENSRIPDGYMEEKAFLNFQSKLPMTSVEKLMELIVKAQTMYASYGITTVQDGMVGKPLFELLKCAAEKGLFKLDIVGFADITTMPDIFEKEPDYAEQYCRHFKMGGFKIFLDGSPQGKTAWTSKPYEGEGDYCGYPIYTDETLEEYIELALQKKKQLLAHCNGDAAAEQYITQFEKAMEKLGEENSRRAVMVHAQLVREDQLKRMEKMQMMPSFFVVHTYYWGDIHIRNFGQERGSQISPVKSAVKNHMKYTFHQDTPVVPPDMMRTVWSAVNRVSRSGQSIGENQRVSVMEALKAITVYAAYQYFEEKEKGTVEKGKKADFVILSENPLETEPEKLASVRVLTTIKENEVIYKAEDLNKN